MRYRTLGRSGLRVSQACLGTMTFGEDWGWGASKDESRKIFAAFAEAGGNFLDTANVYTNGTSEKLVGEFIAAERSKFVVATKYTCQTAKKDPNASGNHRKNMVQSLEASLKRLSTDYVDLLWVHAYDDLTPIEETMRALDDLVRAGKVLYVGISDVPAWVVAKANTLAEFRGWSSFVGLQIEYSLIERTAERDLLPMARDLQIGVTAWAPLGGGVLTGKYRTLDINSVSESKRKDLNKDRLSTKNLAIIEEIVRIEKEHGMSAVQIALSWLSTRESKIIPILGARSEKQIQDCLGYVNVVLSDEDLKRLDAVSRVDLGFPHEFLQREAIQKVIFGGTRSLIDR